MVVVVVAAQAAVALILLSSPQEAAVVEGEDQQQQGFGLPLLDPSCDALLFAVCQKFEAIRRFQQIRCIFDAPENDYGSDIDLGSFLANFRFAVFLNDLLSRLSLLNLWQLDFLYLFASALQVHLPGYFLNIETSAMERQMFALFISMSLTM